MPRYRLRPLLACLLATVASSACVGDSADPARAPVVVTDSAGVVVSTWGHTEAQLVRWGIEAEPVSRIGAVEGEAPDVFGRITSLEISNGGGLVLTDGLAGEVRVFSPNGAHVASMGGPGEGPGEFSNSLSILRVAGDTIHVWDPRQQRFSVFTNGTFDRSWSPPPGTVVSRPVFAGGRVFAQSGGGLGEPEPGMIRTTTGFTVLGEELPASGLFEVPGHESFLDIRQSNGVISSVNIFRPPFGRGPFFAVTSAGGEVRIVGGPNDRMVLHEWDDSGTLRAIHRYPSLDRPLDDAVIEQARARILARYDEPSPLMNQELATLDLDLPDYVPAFDGLLLDDEARLWLRRSANDGIEEWLVMDVADLRPLAGLTLPAGFTLHDVRDGLLGGVWVDDLDVPHAQVVRLRTGS